MRLMKVVSRFRSIVRYSKGVSLVADIQLRSEVLTSVSEAFFVLFPDDDEHDEDGA